MTQELRRTAVSVIGSYTDKRGEHIVHWLDFVEATGVQDADAKARDAYQERYRQCEIMSVLIEPVPA